MAHGGQRGGAGRKKGSQTKRTAVLKIQAVALGLDPADVLQQALEKYHQAGDWERAIAVANDLMPYRHPKLSSKQVNVDIGLESTQIVELIVTTREQADAAIATLNDASGVSRQ